MELKRRAVLRGKCRACGLETVYVKRDPARRLVCSKCRGKIKTKGYFVDYVA